MSEDLVKQHIVIPRSVSLVPEERTPERGAWIDDVSSRTILARAYRTKIQVGGRGGTVIVPEIGAVTIISSNGMIRIIPPEKLCKDGRIQRKRGPKPKERLEIVIAAPKKRGRPVGSKNKPKVDQVLPAAPKKRGRPIGSKNKPKEVK